MNLGKMIVIEGADYAGKTEFAKQLQRILSYRDFGSTLTNLPGGDTLGRKIREVIVNNPFDADTQTCLFAANRSHLTKQVIYPLLDVGRSIICTRWRWSCDVYQGNKHISDFLDESMRVAIPDVYVFLVTTESVMRKSSEKRLLEEEQNLMDISHTKDYDGIQASFNACYDAYDGHKFKYIYNKGTTVPTDREFIELHKDLLEHLGYFELKEHNTVFLDEIPQPTPYQPDNTPDSVFGYGTVEYTGQSLDGFKNPNPIIEKRSQSIIVHGNTP